MLPKLPPSLTAAFLLPGTPQLDTIVAPGFRGAGPIMRVTQAWGQQVLELDGEPAQRPVRQGH